MSAVDDRASAIETLHRMTMRLADLSLTATEAQSLRATIHRLLDEISQQVTPERMVSPHLSQSGS
ncbi:hypothetical protein ACYOEI_01655 [Singulisphaera rosea]